MAVITAKLVAELRAKTDAPMMECKKALTEADGDLVKAEELLRVKLGTKAGKAASRITAEGVVATYINGNVGAMVEVNSETDFVSKNDSFLALADAAAKLIAEHNPADLEALAALPYEQDTFGPTLEDVRKGLIGKIGENMSFRRSKYFGGSSKLASYLHGSRIGVVVEFEGDEVAAKDVAMHTAAMKPVALTSADVPAELIELEVTEVALMEDPEQALRSLEAIRALGVVLSIDDFGTGYSSLAYLKRLPVQILKIDRTFVSAMVSNASDAVIVHSTIALAHNFGMQVVAEGVEDPATAEALQRAGCDIAQGYLFGRPMAAAAIEEWRRARATSGD